MTQFDQAVKAADKSDQITNELILRSAYRDRLTVVQAMKERITYRSLDLLLLREVY
jgi:hypothetical protein